MLVRNTLGFVQINELTQIFLILKGILKVKFSFCFLTLQFLIQILNVFIKFGCGGKELYFLLMVLNFAVAGFYFLYLWYQISLVLKNQYHFLSFQKFSLVNKFFYPLDRKFPKEAYLFEHAIDRFFYFLNEIDFAFLDIVERYARRQNFV